MKRRSILEFLGVGLTLSFAPGLWSCNREANMAKITDFTLKGILPSAQDALQLAEGFTADILIKWGDSISENDYFGFNNDYTAFVPSKENPNEGILWVNHEYVSRKFVSGYTDGAKRNKRQVETEMYNVGGSLIRIKKENGKWSLVHNHQHNRRVNGQTMIPFNWHEPIAGKTEAMGTLANCSGGITPWGTILTCEENYDAFYGERNYETGKVATGSYGWETFFPENLPEHYGWVVEVNPATGEAQKHIALGRCAHECATVFQLEDGRVVVYTGDDANDECLYKFISSKPNSLKEGTLYVANIEKQRWESLDYNSRPELQAKFSGQTEVLIRLREASKLVGGTPMDRPEDIEIDPFNGQVLVSLTNNKPKGNYHGSIMKIEENGKHDALSFKSDTFVAGGETTGFSCPDNMAFDKIGNLWFTSDISGSSIGKEPYTSFLSNGLYLIPRTGKQAGTVIQVASAPKDAELTGPFFSNDGKTLFLSVQHPGETSPTTEQLSSNWPDGGNNIPRSAVVCVSGESLEKIQSLI